MKLSISQFAGEMPIMAEHLLPENYATKTLNARMEGGSLIPIRNVAPTSYGVASNVNSWAIYPFDKTKTLTRTDEANFIRSPLANDAWDRVYIAGNGAPPQVAYTSGGALAFANLGVNKPATPTVPASWNSAEPPSPDYQVVRCAYYVTNVTQRGEESEPSNTTQIISRWDAASIPVTLGSNNDARSAKRRLYRSEGGGTFNLVGEYPSTTNTVTDNIYSASLGAPCNSESYNHPPSNLSGLTMVGNGFLAGFFGNTLCFCEPYYPHAWPIEYQYAFHDDIVGIAVTGGSVIVTTTGNPWIVTGGHPSAMSQTRLDLRASNLSRAGLVDMGNICLYPSSEGLVVASPSDVKVISSNVISREQWLAMNPSSFKAFRFRGQYLCFGDGAGFIFNLEHGIFPISIAGTVLSGHYQADEDTLYLLIKNANNTRSVVKFDTGSNMELTWESREFIMSTAGVLSAGRVDADASATIKITGDNYNFNHTVPNDTGFRLPAGRPKRLKIELKSTGRVNTVTLASSMSELL